MMEMNGYVSSIMKTPQEMKSEKLSILIYFCTSRLHSERSESSLDESMEDCEKIQSELIATAQGCKI